MNAAGWNDYLSQLITLQRRKPDNAAPLHRMKATVSAVSAPTVTVTWPSGSTTAGVHYLASYSPNVSDTVFILEQGGDLLIIGELQT